MAAEASKLSIKRKILSTIPNYALMDDSINSTLQLFKKKQKINLGKFNKTVIKEIYKTNINKNSNVQDKENQNNINNKIFSNNNEIITNTESFNIESKAKLSKSIDYNYNNTQDVSTFDISYLPDVKDKETAYKTDITRNNNDCLSTYSSNVLFNVSTKDWFDNKNNIKSNANKEKFNSLSIETIEFINNISKTNFNYLTKLPLINNNNSFISKRIQVNCYSYKILKLIKLIKEKLKQRIAEKSMYEYTLVDESSLLTNNDNAYKENKNKSKLSLKKVIPIRVLTVEGNNTIVNTSKSRNAVDNKNSLNINNNNNINYISNNFASNYISTNNYQATSNDDILESSMLNDLKSNKHFVKPIIKSLCEYKENKISFHKTISTIQQKIKKKLINKNKFFNLEQNLIVENSSLLNYLNTNNKDVINIDNSNSNVHNSYNNINDLAKYKDSNNTLLIVNNKEFEINKELKRNLNLEDSHTLTKFKSNLTVDNTISNYEVVDVYSNYNNKNLKINSNKLDSKQNSSIYNIQNTENMNILKRYNNLTMSDVTKSFKNLMINRTELNVLCISYNLKNFNNNFTKILNIIKKINSKNTLDTFKVLCAKHISKEYLTKLFIYRKNKYYINNLKQCLYESTNLLKYIDFSFLLIHIFNNNKTRNFKIIVNMYRQAKFKDRNIRLLSELYKINSLSTLKILEDINK